MFYRLTSSEDSRALLILLDKNPTMRVCDEILLQLQDLVKLENPSQTLSQDELDFHIKIKLDNIPLEEYGVWVYYPWKNCIVHILDEQEFVKVRTIRNAYKITHEEQSRLANKRIGIVGLSVGQSVSIALAMERIGGELRIADYDTLELSNLNRIRTSIENLAIKKTTLVAREIAEIDPFIKVKCYHSGLDENCIDSFFLDDSSLDMVVEECDSVDVKILVRERAKQYGIPVIMDTSDRGMIDVERYDINKDYPILHGLIKDSASSEFLKSLKSSEEKLPYILPILGMETLSTNLKASGIEVGKSITTWPQLGSDVILGGALCSNVARRILLGNSIDSGRFFIDLDLLIPSQSNHSNMEIDVDDLEFNKELLPEIFNTLILGETTSVSKSDIEFFVEYANMATSPGNSQKWLWYYHQGGLLLVLNKHRHKSFADNFSFGSLLGFGAAIENIRLAAVQKGYYVNLRVLEVEKHEQAVALLTFELAKEISEEDTRLFHLIPKRCSNRNNSEYKGLSSLQRKKLLAVPISHDLHFELIEDRKIIKQIGALICKGDRLRLTNVYGHQDFFKNEIRWSREESALKKDGLDITLFPLTELDKIGLELSKNIETIHRMNEFSGGKGFERISEKNFDGASAIGVVYVDEYNRKNLLKSGQFIEQLWLEATDLQIGFQPYTVLQMLFSRLHSDEQNYLTSNQKKEIIHIKEQFDSLIPNHGNKKSVFLFRLNFATSPIESSFRKPVSSNLVMK
jgi:tRNA A37 threonylcarbamoyladenosine dehydratase